MITDGESLIKVLQTMREQFERTGQSTESLDVILTDLQSAIDGSTIDLERLQEIVLRQGTDWEEYKRHLLNVIDGVNLAEEDVVRLTQGLMALSTEINNNSRMSQGRQEGLRIQASATNFANIAGDIGQLAFA